MKEFDIFLRKQVASSFHILPGANLDIVELADRHFMYSIVADDGYIYSKGYAKISDLDRILKILADYYGKDSYSYQYWKNKACELKNSEDHD